MKKITMLLTISIVFFLFADSASGSQVIFESEGAVNVSYSGVDPSNPSGPPIGGSAEDSYGDGSGSNSAVTNVHGLDGIGGFAFSHAYALNSVGAKSGVYVNSLSSGIPYTADLPPKHYTSAQTSARAFASNRYYFGGGAPGFLTPIRMGFNYDGDLYAHMGGVVASPGAMGSLTFRINVSVYSESGLWGGYEGGGFSWGFSVEDTYDLVFDGDSMVWENESGEILEGVRSISGYEEFATSVFGAVYLRNATYRVDFGIETEVSIEGLEFETGGYIYVNSNFYDTLSTAILTTDVVSDDPFPSVPIPSAVVLLGSGLLGLVGLRKKQNS